MAISAERVDEAMRLVAEREILAGGPSRLRPSSVVAISDSSDTRAAPLERLGTTMPGWVASLVVHAVALLVLGLVAIHDEAGHDLLLLITSVSRLDSDGGEPVVALDLTPDFETQIADDVALDPSSISVVDAFAVSPALPAVGDLGDAMDRALRSSTQIESPFASGGLAGRNPATRRDMALREGGTVATEAAVARGLAWLRRHQHADGRWRLHAFGEDGDCDGTCSHSGTRSDTAGTALALLPFLGAGETHLHGQYQNVVGRGLEWLVDQQSADGDLRGRGSGAMYAHGQAAIVLCEAYALTHDERLREPAQLAIDFIVDAQHRRGGWRYTPGAPGDTSILGWQLMALRSAQMAYLEVPLEVFERADRFLDSVQTESSRGLFGYMPGSQASSAMTAEALLCRQYYGWSPDERQLREGVRWLLGRYPPDKTRDSYYWYYATQVMHHHGGAEWKKWNAKMRTVLVDRQEREGHASGSWSPAGGHDHVGGRLYATSLAICTLEVYYRHLPLYREHAINQLE